MLSGEIWFDKDLILKYDVCVVFIKMKQTQKEKTPNPTQPPPIPVPLICTAH